MQSSGVFENSEPLGIVKRKQLAGIPPVSEITEVAVVEEQLSFDLGSCPKIESGAIHSPTHEEAIGSDFYYALKSLIEHLSQDVEAHKERIFTLNPSRKKNIAHELGSIMSELNEFKTVKSLTEDFLSNILYASYDSLEGKGLQVFCSRVTYYTVIRLILIHYWKGIGLLEKYDKNPYLDPNLTINHILGKTTANLIEEKHNWLFAKQNNYSWYKLSDTLLSDIQTILDHWEFSPQSITIFSFLYEKYLDTHRFRKYAHYTPIPLVRFIWHFLKEHLEDPSLFRNLGHNHVPKLIFDPTMGSGNFLIEAAFLQEEELQQKDLPMARRLKEMASAFTAGLYGCDIDIFAHFFSEIKLLWKLSPLLKEEELLPLSQRINPSLSIIHQNALKLYNKEQLEIVDTEVDPKLSTDTHFGLLPLEGHLKSIHSKIRMTEKFDICIGCPPERILNEQKVFIKETIEKIVYWKKHYEANLLYSSWFFVLGLSKLREGGKLIFVTETYWPIEEGASKLRKYILDESKVLAVIDLGLIKITDDTTPLPRYITLLEKCSSKEERDKHKIKVIKVHAEKEPKLADMILDKILEKTKFIDRPGKIYSDDDIDIYFSGVHQSELDENPWQHVYDAGFSRILKLILTFKTTLNYFCSIEENQEPHEKIDSLITSELGIRNRFSFFQKKPEGGNFIILSPKPISRESIFYVMALLNSRLVNFWYANNGYKQDGRKLFVPTALKMIPIRPIDFGQSLDASLKEEKLAQVKFAIDKGDDKYLMAYLYLELSHGREELVHDAMVLMQKEILHIETHLKRYDQFFLEPLSDWSQTHLSALHQSLPFRKIFPQEKMCLLKEHSAIFIHKEASFDPEQFCLAQFKREAGIKNEGEHLVLISIKNEMLKIYGPSELLLFIEHDLQKQIHNYWNEIELSVFLPKELPEFASFKEDVSSHCVTLKDKQLKWVSLLNHLVYKLYGFNVDHPDVEQSKLAGEAIQMMDAAY